MPSSMKYSHNPALKFSTGVHDIGGEQGANFKGLKRIIEKKSKQFSDEPNRIRIILIVNEYHFGDPVELRPAANKIIDRDELGANVNEIYFLDKKGFFETGKIEKIYPNSEGVEKILEIHVDDDSGEEIVYTGRELTIGKNGEILSIKPIGGER